MERLWSPWRSQFINAARDESPSESPFTKAFREPEKDAEHHLLHRDRLTFIILNKYPYNAGHLLVLPIREVGDLTDLTGEEGAEMMKSVTFAARILRLALSPHGLNIGMNLGRTAGAGIESHVHFHVVPRWNGDTNFMPVLAETRMISESMDDMFGKLVDARDRLLAGAEE